MPVDGAEGRALRLARASSVATVSLAFAGAGHVVAGGQLPGLLVGVPLGAVTFAIAMLVSARTLRVWSLVPVLGLLQLVLHHGMSLLAVPQRCGRRRHRAPRRAIRPAWTCPPSRWTHAVSMSTPMLVAHAVAVVAAALVLAGADRAGAAARRWWAWIAPHLEPVVALPVAGAARARVDHRAPTWALSTAVVAVAPRRGPPRGTAALA